jgi:sugar phosphate isomerase/epimerase
MKINYKDFKAKAAFVIAMAITASIIACNQQKTDQQISLTLIPPADVTNKIDLDVRAGIKNSGNYQVSFNVTFYLNKESSEAIIYSTKTEVSAHGAECVKFLLPTKKLIGENTIIVKITGKDFEEIKEKKITVTDADTRSTKAIGGAWISFYHWSDQEGKNWNPAIKTMTDDQWKEMISSMHEIGMDVVVIQESFRNQEYVGKHQMDKNGYKGKAYYPSKLYPDRMPIAAKDPIEAALSQADKLGMHVFMGVGMYAWFDYTAGSLAWHKKVAKELYDMYGHHPSFYGFYVSEEGMGSLDCFETDTLKQPQRRAEVLNFFRELRPFIKQLAPDKPLMFAPNGWGVARAGNAYQELLKNVDIITPFAFNRMPKGDLTGKAAIDLLQKYCNESQAHLWLDLEAFLFNDKEGYLYPRPMSEIKYELSHYNNFEKVICYQYPGVFNNPNASIRVGEKSTIKLFQDYQQYLKTLKSNTNGNK